MSHWRNATKAKMDILEDNSSQWVLWGKRCQRLPGQRAQDDIENQIRMVLLNLYFSEPSNARYSNHAFLKIPGCSRILIVRNKMTGTSLEAIYKHPWLEGKSIGNDNIRIFQCLPLSLPKRFGRLLKNYPVCLKANHLVSPNLLRPNHSLTWNCWFYPTHWGNTP